MDNFREESMMWENIKCASVTFIKLWKGTFCCITDTYNVNKCRLTCNFTSSLLLKTWKTLIVIFCGPLLMVWYIKMSYEEWLEQSIANLSFWSWSYIPRWDSISHYNEAVRSGPGHIASYESKSFRVYWVVSLTPIGSRHVYT